MTLKCSYCKQEKPTSAFVVESATPRGYRYDCKPCAKIRAKANREARKHKWDEKSPYENTTSYKLCRKCGVSKLYAEFSRDNNRSDGLQARCKTCQMTEWRMSKYGIDLAPDSECAICGRTDKLCIDHCHATSNVRGVLCAWCNTVLGHAKDDPAVLRRAAEYLEKA